MESAGEIWIEEESPVYLQIKENSPQNVSQSATLTEINLTPQDVNEVQYLSKIFTRPKKIDHFLKIIFRKRKFR